MCWRILCNIDILSVSLPELLINFNIDGLIAVVDGPGREHLWDIPVSRITAGIMKVGDRNVSNQLAAAFFPYAPIGQPGGAMPLHTRVNLHKVNISCSLSMNLPPGQSRYNSNLGRHSFYTGVPYCWGDFTDRVTCSIAREILVGHHSIKC